MIDVLKEENDTFEQQLRELKKRFEANEEGKSLDHPFCSMGNLGLLNCLKILLDFT